MTISIGSGEAGFVWISTNLSHIAGVIQLLGYDSVVIVVRFGGPGLPGGPS